MKDTCLNIGASSCTAYHRRRKTIRFRKSDEFLLPDTSTFLDEDTNNVSPIEIRNSAPEVSVPEVLKYWEYEVTKVYKWIIPHYYKSFFCMGLVEIVCLFFLMGLGSSFFVFFYFLLIVFRNEDKECVSKILGKIALRSLYIGFGLLLCSLFVEWLHTKE